MISQDVYTTLYYTGLDARRLSSGLDVYLRAHYACAERLPSNIFFLILEKCKTLLWGEPEPRHDVISMRLSASDRDGMLTFEQ